MIINHNMNAQNAHRFMTGNTANAGKSMEKLSSGLRINRAGDDAAGLAISEKMRAQIRGLDQAAKNSQDGISMIQTAEGGLSETQSILQRMRELATQSANSTNVSVDREEIQKEMNQLSSEINRIGNTTEFNTQKVLNGGGIEKEIDVATVKAGVALGEFKDAVALTATTGTAAVWSTAAVTALGTTGATASFIFNGVTVNITGGGDGVANAIAGETESGTTGTINLTVANDATTANTADAIMDALNQYKTNVGGGTNLLSDYTFALTGGGSGIKITANNVGVDTAQYETAGAIGVVGATSATTAGAEAVSSNSYSVPITTTTGSTAAVAATWKTGQLGGMAATTSSTFTFKGVTVTLNSADAAVTASATDARTASVTIVKGADGAATQDAAANALKSAFEAAQAKGNELDGFTFSVDTTNHTLVITDTKANGATNNSESIVKSGAITTSGITKTAGVTEVRGEYTMTLDKAFEAEGMTLKIGGQTFTAVASGAKAADGEFNVGTDVHEQALSIAAAINADTTLSAQYDATVDDAGKITLKEKATKATGTDLTNGIVSGNLAVAGQQSFDVDELVAVGGKYTIAGVNITVTDDADDAGLANGTAVLYNADKTAQAALLADAMSANSEINTLFNVSASGNTITLDQKAGKESMEATTVTTDTNSKAGFEAKLQIGANTAQSLTVEINDMRSAALKIVGDEASGKVTAKNGAVATYRASKEVTDGTTNTNVEYSLDVSTHEKATAAISVLNDAIESVSAERSRLGAYQNRLEHTISNLGTSSENLTSAESRIRDVDMAKEMMNFSKNNILSQAAQAMLAQANQQPQGVLQLLR